MGNRHGSRCSAGLCISAFTDREGRESKEVCTEERSLAWEGIGAELAPKARNIRFNMNLPEWLLHES